MGGQSKDERKRAEHLDRVFGDVLPSVTSDEISPKDSENSDDDWYLDNRPPHHDRSD